MGATSAHVQADGLHEAAALDFDYLYEMAVADLEHMWMAFLVVAMEFDDICGVVVDLERIWMALLVVGHLTTLAADIPYTAADKKRWWKGKRICTWLHFLDL